MDKIIVLLMGITIGWGFNVYLGDSVNSQFSFATDPEPQVPLELAATFKLDKSTVTWVSDPAEVDLKFAQHELVDPTPEGMERRGIASYSGDNCTIYAKEPKDRNDSQRLQTLGHELLHCFRGDYHE